ncbi:MAG: HNH endonuclease [Paracoccus sp. (in: a-proteobacteria)]|uniref:HNH endonuclease n=1 Tax=Paracoccus sp. TaxID=267 RepID=UPI0032D8E097
MPRLFDDSDAAAYLGVSPPVLEALGIKRKALSPRIKRYDRLDLDQITPAQIKRVRRAVGELAPKRKNTVLDIVRAFVYDRDGMVCRYCGDEDGPFHLDHVLPLARGGDDEATNLTVACASCNCSKGQKTLEEWGWPRAIP